MGSRLAVRLVLAGVFLAAAVPSSAEDGCNVRNVQRVVAVGDVHGAYDNFVSILQMMGLVDEEIRWIGGRTHFVQTGDLLDRGTRTREVLDLMMRLEKEAKKAGGRVHALLGNHEVMNMMGDLRYVVADEYEAFTTWRSDALREDFIDRVMDRARRQARSRREAFDAKAYRANLEKQAPLGFVERQEAFSPEGAYGKWLRKRDAVARIDGVVFLHAGLSLEVAELGCETINKTVRREITKDFQKTRRNGQETLSGGPEGPLWYRGLAKEDETAFAPVLDEILLAMKAHAIVIGHTVTDDGRIHRRFGGRVILIDTGMSPAYRGSLAALEIGADGVMTAVHPDLREPIDRPAATAARLLSGISPLASGSSAH